VGGTYGYEEASEMQTTAISEMQTIILDNEFQDLLPALDGETYGLLEENILANGCRDPLVLWDGILIDGYNRYRICMEHDISFDTVDKEFDSRAEVLIWIVSNQISRRNLSPVQLSFFRGVHYRADKQIQGANNQFVQLSEKRQNDVFQGSTTKRLALKYQVSPKTIERDARFAAGIEAIGEASPEAKRKILSGEVAVNRTKLQALSSGQKDDIEAVAAEIDEGTYVRRASTARPTEPIEAEASIESETTVLNSAEMKQREKIIGLITDQFNILLQKVQQGDMAEMKISIWEYIDALELLCKKQF